MEDKKLSRIAGSPKRRRHGYHQLGGDGWAAPGQLGERPRKLDAGSPPAPDAHNARTTWLSTLNGDGSPHVTAVGALWLDESFWFQTGSGTRKARNVARDPCCSIVVSILDADVVAEGAAEREPDPGTLTRVCHMGGPGLARRTR